MRGADANGRGDGMCDDTPDSGNSDTPRTASKGISGRRSAPMLGIGAPGGIREGKVRAETRWAAARGAGFRLDEW